MSSKEEKSLSSTGRQSFQARSQRAKSRDDRRVEFISHTERKPSTRNTEWGSPFPPVPIRSLVAAEPHPTSDRPGYDLATLPPAPPTTVDPSAIAMMSSMRCLDTDGAPSAIDEKRFADDYYIRTLKALGQSPRPFDVLDGDALLAPDESIREPLEAEVSAKGKSKKGKKGRSRSQSKSKSRSDSKSKSRSSSSKKKSKSRSDSKSKSRSSSSKKTGSAGSKKGRKARKSKSPPKRTREDSAGGEKKQGSQRSKSLASSSASAGKRNAPPGPPKGPNVAPAKEKHNVDPSPSATQSTKSGGATGKKSGKGQSNVDVSQFCLKKINMGQFARMKPKQKHKAMMVEFVNAYELGLKMFETDYTAELAHIEKIFREQSHDPQTKEVLRLVYGIQYIRMDCYKKLSLAEAVVNALVTGISDLLDRMRSTGALLLEKDETLIFEAPFIGPDPSHAEGVPMPEVRDADDVLKEAHPRSLAPNEATAKAINTINQFFQGNFDFLKEDMLHLTEAVVIPAYDKVETVSRSRSRTDELSLKEPVGSDDQKPAEVYGTPISLRSGKVGDTPWSGTPVKQGTMKPIRRENSSSSGLLSSTASSSQRVLDSEKRTSKAEAIAFGISGGFDEELERYSRHKKEEAEKVQERIGALTAALSNLMDRIETQHKKFRKKLEAQQRILDEGSTHVKAADNVMENQMLDQTEAKQATTKARELGKELRERMDRAEAEMRETIQKVLDDSAIVSHENMAYRDFSALADKKADCESYMMSRMTRSMLDQSEIMRDLQYGILSMWSKNHPTGREEKNTVIHRTLPDEYNHILKQCTRDTLLRIVYHLSQQSDESLRCLMGVLDEHEHFLETHSQEAEAVKEEEATMAAVAKLIKKMFTEGRIHANPHKMSTSLPETINFIVDQYNAFMSFSEDYARALVRREDRHKSKTSSPFFGEETPLPAILKAIREHTVRACPYSPSLYPKPEAMSLGDLPSKGKPEEVPEEPDLPQKKSPWPAGPLPVLKPTAADVVTALHGANPSVADTRMSKVSVVGNGRWDGHSPLQSAGTTVGPPPSFMTQPRVAYRRIRNPAVITQALEAEAEAKHSVVPGLPTRSGLNAYVMETYNHQLEDLLQDNMVLPDPAKAMKKYNNPDAQFLDRRLEIHKELEAT